MTGGAFESDYRRVGVVRGSATPFGVAVCALGPGARCWPLIKAPFGVPAGAYALLYMVGMSDGVEFGLVGGQYPGGQSSFGAHPGGTSM